MINLKYVKSYCCDDIRLIENYDEAINSNEIYDCHHRLEIELNLTRNELKEKDLYLQRPASELIFLTKSEHTRLHNKERQSPNGMLSKHHSEETKEKISKKMSELQKGKKRGKYKKKKAALAA